MRLKFHWNFGQYWNKMRSKQKRKKWSSSPPEQPKVSHKQTLRLRPRDSFQSFSLSQFFVLPSLFGFNLLKYTLFCAFMFVFCVCYTIAPSECSVTLIIWCVFLCVRGNKNFYRMSCSGRYKSDQLSRFSVEYTFYSL